LRNDRIPYHLEEVAAAGFNCLHRS
jgi:hypothetical protein